MSRQTMMSARTWVLLAMMVATALGGAGSAVAQTDPPPSTPTGAPDDADPAEVGRTTFDDLGYGDTTLRGTYGSADLFIPIDPGVRGTAATVTLALRTSPLLIDRSTLTVLAGGVEVTSSRIGGDASPQELVVDVPADAIGPSGIAIGLRGFLRLTDDSCEETDNPGQWVTVLDSSSVDLRSVPASLDVADVPRTFGSGPGDRVISLTADPAADPQVVAAAAWQLGRFAQLDRSAAVVTDGTPSTDAPTHAVTLTTTDVTAPTLSLSGGSVPALDVAGADDAAVRTAVDALGQPALLASLTSPSATLTDLDPAPAADVLQPWRLERTTFAQLGIDQLVVGGTGQRTVVAAIERPAGWEITDEVVVTLDLDVSPALRPDTSTLQLLVDGTDAGTQPLTPGPDGDTQLRFTLPAGLADRQPDGRPTRSLALTAIMVLDLPEAECSSPPAEAARVAILPTSSVTVPHGFAETLELGRFPHPLTRAAGQDADRQDGDSQDGDSQDGVVQIVLPSGALDAGVPPHALQAAASLGRWADTRSAAPVLVTVDDPSVAEPDDTVTGRLVLGTDAVRVLAADVAPTSGTLAEEDVLAGLSIAEVDGLPTVLIDGDGPGVLAALRLLGDPAAIRDLDGDVAALTAEGVVVLSRPDAVAPPPELAPTADDAGDVGPADAPSGAEGSSDDGTAEGEDRPDVPSDGAADADPEADDEDATASGAPPDGGDPSSDTDRYLLPTLVVGLGLLAALIAVIAFRWMPAWNRARDTS